MKNKGIWVIVSVLIVLVLLTVGVSCQEPAPSPTPAPAPAPAPSPAPPAPSPTPPAPSPTPIPEMKLIAGAPFPEVTSLVQMTIHWEELITEGSGGKITFENYWGGSLFEAGESIDVIQEGVADVIMTSSGYAPGKLLLRNWDIGVPFRPESAPLYLKVQRTMFSTIPAFTEELTRYNIKEVCLDVGPSTGYDINSTTPIVTLDDMKGKKLAVLGTEFPKWVAAVEAVPVTMPAGDRYVALQRGTIDGQLNTVDFVFLQKFYEVAQHHTWATLGNLTSCGIWVNLDLFNSLTPQVQKLFLDAGRETEEWKIKMLEDLIPESIQNLEKAGVTFHTMPDAELLKWAQIMPDYPAEWAKEMDAQGLPGSLILETFIKLCEDEGYVWPRRWGES